MKAIKKTENVIEEKAKKEEAEQRQDVIIIDPDNDAVYTDCEYHSERRGLFWTDSEPAVVYPKVILAIAGKEQIEGVDLGKYKDYCDET